MFNGYTSIWVYTLLCSYSVTLASSTYIMWLDRLNSDCKYLRLNMAILISMAIFVFNFILYIHHVYSTSGWTKKRPQMPRLWNDGSAAGWTSLTVFHRCWWCLHIHFKHVRCTVIFFWCNKKSGISPYLCLCWLIGLSPNLPTSVGKSYLC